MRFLYIAVDRFPVDLRGDSCKVCRLALIVLLFGQVAVVVSPSTVYLVASGISTIHVEVDCFDFTIFWLFSIVSSGTLLVLDSSRAG